MSVAVAVTDLVKTFGAVTAVDRVSFTVADGEIVGLLGPNGAGKSTLMRMLTTLLRPTSGSAAVHGFDVATHASDVRHSIGVIPQATTADLDLSVEENLTVFAGLYGLSRAQRLQAITELLDTVELQDRRHALVKHLSGGMRRRVEIARGLLHRPRVLFLDEPTTGLDPVTRARVWQLLARLRDERHLTILLTTHYMDEADRLCDRIAIMHSGSLAALDTPARLKAVVEASTVVEARLDAVPPGWAEQVVTLPGVLPGSSSSAISPSDTADGGVVRLSTSDGPATMTALMQLAAASRVTIRALTVQPTTLDDVFAHFTGRALDEVRPPTRVAGEPQRHAR